ncbi:MAG: VOC family protein [Coriobacteriales bacterium]|nr:VOC family protein [Coriobacteriales bacterium]
MELSVQHIDIHCDDLDKAVDFYTNVLGFTYLFSPVDDGKAPMELVWLRNSSGVIIELTHEKSDYDAEKAARACLNHIALRTTDVDSAVAQLKAKGVEIELDPVTIEFTFDKPLAPEYRDTFTVSDGKTAQMRVAFFRGPSGERIELVQDNLG